MFSRLVSWFKSFFVKPEVVKERSPQEVIGDMLKEEMLCVPRYHPPLLGVGYTPKEPSQDVSVEVERESLVSVLKFVGFPYKGLVMREGRHSTINRRFLPRWSITHRDRSESLTSKLDRSLARVNVGVGEVS